MEDINQRVDMEEDKNTNDDYYSDIEEYEYEERRPLSFRSTLQKLKQNDPTVTQIDGVGLNDQNTKNFFDSIDWKEDGKCISDNQHLKKVHISFYNDVPPQFIPGDDKHRQQLQDFFSCIYRNSSINQILMYSRCILDEFGGSLIEGLSGHSSLTKLEVCGQSRKGDISPGCTALGKVLNHPKSKVEDLRVSYCKLDDDSSIDILFDSLLGNSTLKRLSFNGKITSVGLRALSNVIRDPRCKLARLSLTQLKINDEEADILGRALCGLSSVKVLDLSLNRSITNAGWQTLLNKLSKVSLVSLDLGGNDIDVNGGMSALVNIGTLKSLKLSSNHSMTPTGWQSFFNSVRIGGTQLVKLDISDTNIGNEGLVAMGAMLSNMSMLKTLCMTDIGGLGEAITSQGWISFFNALQGSNLDLINLFLGGEYRIDDDGIQALARLVSRMSSLKWLSLGLMNRSVTPFGWQVLTDYLQSPNFALKQLYIGDNNINDDTVVAFTRALVRNNTLKLLHLYQDPEDFEDGDMITERGWEALSTLLCNSSSTMDIYNSHHMLQDLTDDYNQYDDMDLPDKLVSLLELNRNKVKVEVARQKILQTHFSGMTNIQEFLDMELEMIPTAISWIGRPEHQSWNGTNVSGLSTLYNVIRRVPDLFDSSTSVQTKK